MADLDEHRALLDQSAVRELQLIEDEIAAERELAKARQRLEKIESQFEELRRERNERKARVTEAKAILDAVQRRRAVGPALGQDTL